MEPQIQIRRIPAEATVDIRWAILRPAFSRETAVFPGDDAPGTVHFAAFAGSGIMGVASLFDAEMPEEPSAGHAKQLRGMATLPEVRGSGCGRALLEACVQAAREEGCRLLWCNARIEAASFYQKHGWEVCSSEFDIPTVGPHFRMRKLLQD